MIENCPVCGSIPRAYWREIFKREMQFPSEVIHNIPMQEYTVECSHPFCYTSVGAVYEHRSPALEKLLITAWNLLPKDYLENK